MGPLQSKKETKSLPWWTWIAPLFLLEAGDQLSLLFKYSESFSAFYLPTAIGIVLINWWGPARVLPNMFIIGTLNSWFYNMQNLWLWPIFGSIETVAVFLSWLLFTHQLKGDSSLPNTRHTVLFLVFGLFVPILFEVALWEFAYILDGAFSGALYWERFIRDLLSELIANLGVALPTMFFLTPILGSAKLLLNGTFTTVSRISIENKNLPEVLMIFLALSLMSFIISFDSFWFVYGLFSLYLAIRFGFGMAVLGNAFLFFISYLVPALIQHLWLKQNFVINDTLTNALLGSLLLYLFTTITGRVISDLKIAEEKLHEQNLELNEINKELDRFVYSVSHDLSAPLKSIQGLVNISQLDSSAEHKEDYLSKIEQSVSKLDLFIKEILDYSRNKRLDVQTEKIPLKLLCEEIIENLKYMDNFQTVKFDLEEIDTITISTDRLRLKMILTNLLSNAIKFQKRRSGEIPSVQIGWRANSSLQEIVIQDNGEGIKPEYINQIFGMFFRGQTQSIGSGLGLYIAHEAAEKIGGRILVSSAFGKGSIFTIEIPLNR
ncbi:MAG: ATP-binding protein [Bacteroidota bacterium]|mgnify:CR=1 FL=1